MKRYIYTLLTLSVAIHATAQFRVTAHQEGWEETPPQAVREGFYLQKRMLAQMDNETGQEEILVFGHDNGHYPTFDLFKVYYVIVDHYSKNVKYLSSVYVNDSYYIRVEDRNDDGRSELYISYFKNGHFSTDEHGYDLQATRCYDRIECTESNPKNAKK